jgi:tetratricopeptide (TPR) repeat protein
MRNNLLLVIVVSFVAGAVGAGVAMWAREDPPPVRASAESSDADVAALRAEVAELRRAVDRSRSSRAGATRQDPAEAAPSRDVGPVASDKPEKSDGDLPEFERLRRKVFSWQATPEESLRFWELARTSDMLPRLIEQMSKAVEADPENIPARLQLAQAYIAKLYTVPDGPERGAWAMRADAEWRKVLKLDDTNWEARFSIAYSLSQWPKQFNRAPEAIKEFETLVAQQETMRPEPRHAQVYLQLALMYREQGSAKKAEEILRRGLERHPDSEQLAAALAPAEEGGG